MSKFKAAYVFKSVFDIDASFFENEGISHILIDIDNTLVPDNYPYADERAKQTVKGFQELGLDICLVSNNSIERVLSFNSDLMLDFVFRAGKPFVGKIKRKMNELGYVPDKTILIGDQLLTDIFAGNMCGVRTMLVNPIDVSRENSFFRLKRFIEKKIFMRNYK